MNINIKPALLTRQVLCEPNNSKTKIGRSFFAVIDDMVLRIGPNGEIFFTSIRRTDYSRSITFQLRVTQILRQPS